MEEQGLQHFFNAVARFPLLTGVEERELAQRIEKGDPRAKQKLVEHNIRLAIHYAKKYQGHGIDLEDLIQEAMFGLHRAVEKFDWRRGTKFSTYATWWIRHSLQRTMHNSGATIRIPPHVADIRRRALIHLKQHPDAEPIAIAEALSCSVEHVILALNPPTASTSLDTPLGDERDGATLQSLIGDDGEGDPQHMFAERDERVTRAMAQLPEIQRRVIELRFGFTGSVHSRDEIAEKLDVRPHVVQRAQRAGLAHLQRILKGTIEVKSGDGSRGTYSSGSTSAKAVPCCARPRWW